MYEYYRGPAQEEDTRHSSIVDLYGKSCFDKNCIINTTMFLHKLISTKVVYLEKRFILFYFLYASIWKFDQREDNYMEVTLRLETFTVKAGIFLRSCRLRDNN